MSLILVLLLTAAVAAYVIRPLFGGPVADGPVLPSVALPALVMDGVAYQDEDEWAIDRALDKAAEGEPELQAYRSQADLEAEIEEKVVSIKAQRREARAQSKRTLCEKCGKPFQAGDRFCARCGDPHPNVCAECGERHRPGDRFCTGCGSVLPGGSE